MSEGGGSKAWWGWLHGRPVLHFFLIGAVLFAVNAWRHGGGDTPDDANIVVDRPRLEALAGIWRAQFGRPPNRTELTNVAKAWAVEEMRVREARRLGLDQDDSVIRRRLAQKFSFLISSPTALTQPSDAALRQYLAAHADRYAGPVRYRFEQVFFSSDRGPEQALAAARAALKNPAAARGDAFPGAAADRDATEEEIRQDYGSNFVAALPRLAPGVWQGPIESGFGFHLVKITRRTAAAAVEFNGVRGQVLADWMNEAAAAAEAKAAADLERRYHVSLDQDAVRTVASAERPR